MNDIESLLLKVAPPAPPAALEERVVREAARRARPQRWGFVAMAAALLGCAAALVAILMPRPAVEAPAKGQDREPVELRVEVTNFYRDGAGKTWSSGAWEIRLDKDAKTAAVRRTLALDKETVGWEGSLAADTLLEALTDLKKRGLFTVPDSAPCRCDAPQFKVTAREGAASHAFAFRHSHDDHDQAQKEIVEAIRALADKHLARKGWRPRAGDSITLRIAVKSVLEGGGGHSQRQNSGSQTYEFREVDGGLRKVHTTARMNDHAFNLDPELFAALLPPDGTVAEWRVAHDALPAPWATGVLKSGGATLTLKETKDIDGRRCAVAAVKVQAADAAGREYALDGEAVLWIERGLLMSLRLSGTEKDGGRSGDCSVEITTTVRTK